MIYKINCKYCDKVYLGRTSRALWSRTRLENTRERFSRELGILYQPNINYIKYNCDFDLDDVKIIDRCSQWSKRLFLEAWHSIRETNSINEHIYIPDIYKALGNIKWRSFGSFFAFASHFIAEEGYSILTETSLHKVF